MLFRSRYQQGSAGSTLSRLRNMFSPVLLGVRSAPTIGTHRNKINEVQPEEVLSEVISNR